MPDRKSSTIPARAALAVAVLLAATLALAAAHKMHVDLYLGEGATIEGEAYYSAESKVAGATVVFFAPDDKKLGETRTDDNGAFSFEAKYRCDHRVTVTLGGHRGTATLPAEDLPDSLPPYEGGGIE